MIQHSSARRGRGRCIGGTMFHGERSKPGRHSTGDIGIPSKLGPCRPTLAGMTCRSFVPLRLKFAIHAVAFEVQPATASATAAATLTGSGVAGFGASDVRLRHFLPCALCWRRDAEPIPCCLAGGDLVATGNAVSVLHSDGSATNGSEPLQGGLSERRGGHGYVSDLIVDHHEAGVHGLGDGLKRGSDASKVRFNHEPPPST